MLPSSNSVERIRDQTNKFFSLESLFDSIDFSFVWKNVRRRYSLHGRHLDAIAMFKLMVLKEIKQLQSRRKMAEYLKSREGKFWVKKFGFKKPPSHNTFSKFVKRLGADTIEQIFKDLVKTIGETIDIGRIVAVDSTLLKGYARDWKNRECSDPDAKWGYSTTKEWVFGYKVHLACDAELELPLAFTVTPANVYDSTKCFTLLSKISRQGIKSEYVIADAGYDTKDNYYLISHVYHAVPIIALNRRNLKKKTRDFENYLPIKRDTDLWKVLYQKRGSVERVFSRLKEELALKMVKVRKLENVKIHVATSLITMLCVALVATKSGNVDLSKSINSFKF